MVRPTESGDAKDEEVDDDVPTEIKENP